MSDEFKLYKMQSQRVLKKAPPKPIVGPFDQVFRDPKVTHMGPSTVQNQSTVDRNKGVMIESMEDVFLNENFDMRDEFDSAISVQNQVMDEMTMPVMETVTTNSEIPDADLEKSLPSSPVEKILKNKNQLIKYGAIAAAAFILLRGK